MNEKINYEEILKNYPWIVKKNLNCIISPDADGIICGLFMSNYLNWNIVGYYDNGKNLIIKNGILAKNCIFLDTEICRREIRSCGHHIVRFRNSENPLNWDNFSNCLNPNNLRKRSLKENFSLKYPMGTIHLLLCIVGYKYNIRFSKEALFAILQADGTINRFIDRYSENLIDWLNYLDISNANNNFNKLLHSSIDFIEFSKKYVDYIQSFVKQKKDKIPISDSNNLILTSFNSSLSAFSRTTKDNIVDYINFLSKKTGWIFRKDKWMFENFKILRFTKKKERPGVRNYKKAVEENFVSLAITKGDLMEYTVEGPDKII